MTALGDLVDRAKDPNEVAKEDRKAVVRCTKRHLMGIVTRDDALILGGQPVALSTTRDINAVCPHPGCPDPRQRYAIDMEKLRAVAGHWRRQPIDILITDIATPVVDG